MATADIPADAKPSDRPPGAAERCIVLTPSPQSPDWRSAIAVAAQRAGLDVVDYAGGPLDPVIGADRRLFVVRDGALAMGLNPASLVVIMTGVAASPGATSALEGTDPAAGIWESSRLLAEAARLDQQAGYVVDADLGDSPRELTLLPGLAVLAPARLQAELETPLSQAAGKAFQIFSNGPPAIGSRARWSTELFTYDTRLIEQRRRVEEMDVTGRPRALVFGPYISLPPGLWRATARFSVDERACRHQYRFEWGDTTTYNSEVFIPQRPGVFQVTLQYLWTAVTASEARLILTEGSLGGTFTFEGVEVERVE